MCAGPAFFDHGVCLMEGADHVLDGDWNRLKTYRKEGIPTVILMADILCVDVSDQCI